MGPDEKLKTKLAIADDGGKEELEKAASGHAAADGIKSEKNETDNKEQEKTNKECKVEDETKEGVEKSNDEQEEQKKEEEEEAEPKLKYERMSNDIQKLLKNDYVSCVAFHPKIICIGTRLGNVRLFDHLGNSIANRHLKAHIVSVNQISIDGRCEYLISCSDDGYVYLYGLFTYDNNNHEMNTQRSIKSVAIDPEYYRLGSNRRFITGDTEVTLYEKTFLSRTKSTVLGRAVIDHIRNIRWNGQYVLWACDAAITVYDLTRMKRCALVKWPRNELIIPVEYPCSLCWKDSTTFLIGWVDHVELCQIRDCTIYRVKGQVSVNVSGVAPLDNDQIVVLGYPKEKDRNGKSERPMMCFLQTDRQPTAGARYQEVAYDRLSLREYAEFGCKDLFFEYLLEETQLLIACPKDAVIACFPNADDRIDWLVAHNKFDEAMNMIGDTTRYGAADDRNSYLSVGKKYINYLLEKKEYQKAGELCSRVLTGTQLWEEAFFKFAGKHQLRAISRHLPRDPANKLNPRIYEMVLYEYLKVEPEVFLDVVKTWPPDLYNTQAIIHAVWEHINKNPYLRQLLLESLAILHTNAGQFDKALMIYLKLRHQDVFRLAHQHRLYDRVHDIIKELMELDSERTLSLLLDDKGGGRGVAATAAGVCLVPPDTVISKLRDSKYYLYLYLEALDKDVKEIGKKYHGLLVELHAHFAPSKLLPLLKRSDNYPIQQALTICQANQLYPEMVYLLGRIGNTNEALQLLIDKIGDIEQAISFCKEHDDLELWHELIDRSLIRGPDFISYLLQKIGSNVDPRMLIRRIDNHMHIPGLKNSLVKMMQDYNLQVSIKEGCKNIIVSDYNNLYTKLVGMRRHGISIDDERCCNMCHQKVLIRSSEQKTNLLLFNCHHSFHQECLPTKNEKCIICYSEKPPICSFPS